MDYQAPDKIPDAARHLYQRGLIVAGDGNISVRSSEQVWITPRGVSKADLSTADLACLSLDGETIRGNPSSERLMHIKVYQTAPEARAVVHAHPPHAIALSLARYHWQELPIDALPEVIIAAGRIPIAPYARPGTAAMGEVLSAYLPECRIIILARHGALCWGETLAEAIHGVERLEQICQILKLSEELGGAHPLPRQEIIQLKKIRQQIGNRII